MKRHMYQAFDSTPPLAGAGAAELQRAWVLEGGRRSQPARVAALYRRAAEAGQPSAMINLGAMLAVGDGVRANPAEARRWYGLAWKLSEDEGAAFNIAVLYDSVTDDARLRADRRLAEHWYGLAAKLGLGTANRNLGYLLWTSRSARKQRAGVRLMVEHARGIAASPSVEREPRNRTALFNLGIAFEYGPGVRKNLRRAMGFYRRAADAGDPDARVALGYNLLNGIGAARDVKAAVRWYRMACADGNLSAHFTLGQLYSEGLDVRKDLRRARAHLRFAARRGHAMATKLLASLRRAS